MTIKLYGHELSANARRAIATLKEKGVPYEWVNVDIKKGEHKAPDYLIINPFGVVPTMEDGDLRISESRAVARYVASKYAGQGTELLGATAGERALVDHWLEVEGQNFEPAARGILVEIYFKKVFYGLPPDPDQLAKSKEKLQKVLDIYEERLGKVSYLAGESFSLADLSHLPFAEYLFDAGEGELFNSRPNVKAWWERISTRPAWKETATASWLDPSAE